ncbi:MAG: tRNA 2-thiouridine(34) synthase MnmA [Spirochaetaceae bacterium]|jgi:tRNA-specific 2-thiouridylase|nr:tRNA 2-thiouridine(34) synthase MnmA [Spirochaetaceae bacterium]
MNKGLVVNHSNKAIIAMSGGVDSAVAASLALEAGLDCIGITLKLYAGGSRCCSLEDINDARLAAGRLGMPHYVMNATEAFKDNVIERFIAAYENGDTPNPCIDCNRYIKWPCILHRMQEIAFDYIVTGHYARIISAGRWLLKKGIDPHKDQSYVLYMLTQEELAHTILPLGGMTKEETREVAHTKGIINPAKEESQDICFVPDNDYGSFIEGWTGKLFSEGTIIDTNGAVLGRHKGYQRYTIGQRKGLGIAANTPLYVCGKDPVHNTVTLGSAGSLYTQKLLAGNINLIACETIPSPTRLTAATRYQAKEAACTVQQIDEDTLEVRFDEPQRAITPGQSVVLYDGDIVVGGGIINHE